MLLLAPCSIFDAAAPPIPVDQNGLIPDPAFGPSSQPKLAWHVENRAPRALASLGRRVGAVRTNDQNCLIQSWADKSVNQ